jgi:small GTP-binding protein
MGNRTSSDRKGKAQHPENHHEEKHHHHNDDQHVKSEGTKSGKGHHSEKKSHHHEDRKSILHQTLSERNEGNSHGKSGKSSSSDKKEKDISPPAAGTSPRGDSPSKKTEVAPKKLKFCVNCECEFNPENNTSNSCRYHPGKKDVVLGSTTTFYWECCKKHDMQSGSYHSIPAAIIGVKGVGKTALITRLALYQFLDDIRPPEAGDSSVVSQCSQELRQITYVHSLNEIPHVAADDYSKPEFTAVLNEAEIILLVCAVDDLQSLLKLDEYYKKIKSIRKDKGNCPFILVGNKSDVLEEFRKVEQHNMNAYEFSDYYVEFSSKTGMGTDDLLDLMLTLSISNGCHTQKHETSK